MSPLTDDELSHPQKEVDSNVLHVRLRQLKHNVAPCLEGLHNEHLLALLLSNKRQQSSSAVNATSNFVEYANAIVTVELRRYFYVA